MKNLILVITLLVSITCSSFAQHTVRMKGFVVFSDWVGVDGVIVDVSENGEIISINEVSDFTKIKKVIIQLPNGSKNRNSQLSVAQSIVNKKISVQAVNDIEGLQDIKRSMINEIIMVDTKNNSFDRSHFRKASINGMMGVVLPIVGTTVGVLSGGTIPVIVGGVVGLVLQVNSWNHINKAGTELDSNLRILNRK